MQWKYVLNIETVFPSALREGLEARVKLQVEVLTTSTPGGRTTKYVSPLGLREAGEECFA
jgi:hypothetical protein